MISPIRVLILEDQAADAELMVHELRRAGLVSERMAAALLQASQPDRKVEFVIAPDLVTEGDPHMLRIVLDNLLGNGWKFTGKQSTARIVSGPRARLVKERHFTFHCRRGREGWTEVRSKVILLVEDNSDDEILTLRAIQQKDICSEVVLTHDGAEALQYPFGEGAYAGRDMSVMPDLVLLDLNLPKVGGLEVLQRMREDPRTKYIPVVVLTSSSEDKDVTMSYALGANSYVRKPVDFARFAEVVKQLGIYWLVLNTPAATP